MNLKKKITGAIVTTALGAALIGGGSFALFTDTAVNAGNTFTTGGVTITDVTGGPAINATMHFANLAPGDRENFKVKIQNTDTLAAWVKVSDEYGTSGELFAGATPLTVPKNNQVIKIEPGETKEFDFSYQFPLAAGNEYQDKTGTLDINFEAVQVKNNTNAAGNGPLSWE